MKTFQMFRKVRTDFGKQVRKSYESGETYYRLSEIQRRLPRTDGIANTITTVDKDLYTLVYEDNDSTEPDAGRK